MTLIKSFFLVSIFFFSSFSFTQNLTSERAETFMQALLQEKDLTNFISDDALQFSTRLEIQYENVADKFLISYDIEKELKEKVKKKEISYKVTVSQLEKNYSRLDFSIKNSQYQRSFYFENCKLIAPIKYHTQNWQLIESVYFKFYTSDSTQFNSYCVQNLDEFFLRIAKQLRLEEQKIQRIQQQKIYYFLCKDSREIEKLTGYNTRGMYNLAYDYVITTFNAHYHELIHLLINYKIGRLPLYTHPFLQEGVAVALGGRGGKEPEVILNIGKYLYESQFIDLSELLKRDDFYNVNASLSYPASGIYIAFLLEELGIENFLKLYLKYSGSTYEVEKMQIPLADFPEKSVWEKYLQKRANLASIGFLKAPAEVKMINKSEFIHLFQDTENYYFEINDRLLISDSQEKTDFQSSKFFEIFPNQKYKGEKYAIIANSNEIMIYNLFTNNLIANYVRSFSINNLPVPEENGFFKFSVKKNVFDDSSDLFQLELSNQK